MHQFRSYIVEGVDRLGKGTLIKNLQHKFGFFNVIHYAKPELLKTYLHLPEDDYEGAKQLALETYQRASFKSGFNLLSSGERFIMDRFHLGETVYAKRYRGYDGDYVFDMEAESIFEYEATSIGAYHATVAYPAKLILLTTSDFSFIQDDGLSFDFSKKEEEQADFIKAFERSKLPKVMVDVSNGKGGYKSALDILAEVLNG